MCWVVLHFYKGGGGGGEGVGGVEGGVCAIFVTSFLFG